MSAIDRIPRNEVEREEVSSSIMITPPVQSGLMIWQSSADVSSWQLDMAGQLLQG